MLTSVRSLLAATFVAGSVLTATPALADSSNSAFTVSGSAAIVSQYRFRGLAQSDNLPAVQGSILLTHSSGFYVGTWGSSASAGNSPIDIGGTEIDVYGGYSHTFSKSGLTIDGGIYSYLYPGAPTGNILELYGDISKTYGPITAKVGLNYAPAQKVFDYNFTSSSRENAYIYGELSAAIPGTPFSVHSHLGHTGGGFDYGQPYWDYTVGVSASWKALTLDASLVGTTLTHSDINTDFGCADQAACTDYFYRMAKPVGVVSLTASF